MDDCVGVFVAAVNQFFRSSHSNFGGRARSGLYVGTQISLTMAILFSNKFLAAGARRNSISSQFVLRRAQDGNQVPTRRSTPYYAFRRVPAASQLPAKTRRKHRDREKIAEVCSERTAIKDNQRVESFIHEVGHSGLGNLFRSCLPPYHTPLPPVSLRATPQHRTYRSTAVDASRFERKKTIFL